jgi:hypothetical protein
MTLEVTSFSDEAFIFILVVRYLQKVTVFICSLNVNVKLGASTFYKLLEIFLRKSITYCIMEKQNYIELNWLFETKTNATI